jgi:ABC-2 type transport system ATP-binding protein
VVATNTPEQLMTALAGESGYELEVEGSIDQGRLLRIPGVKAVDFLADEAIPIHHQKLRLTLEAGTDPGRDIAATIVGSGLGLYEMRRTRVSLEDVFLELTTEEKTVDSEAMAQAYERAAQTGTDPGTDISIDDNNPDPAALNSSEG